LPAVLKGVGIKTLKGHPFPAPQTHQQLIIQRKPSLGD
jgi:hypothetical protein